MSSSLLEARGLTAGYDTPVLGPLSLQVEPGEVIGVWGANGCGKSTLLKAVAGQARIFSGTLRRRPGLTLGWQLQQPVRLAEMPFSGRDYLLYARAQREPPPSRLAPLLGRRVDALSGGQFQLLAVWAILGGGADLVLLDEPTNNLDPQGEQLLAEILRAERGKRAVLLVSHERRFLDSACNRVLELEA